MAVTDHRYIENSGLLIENGDFALVESEQDHIKDIVLDNKGEWKQFPLVGVGALQFLNATRNLDDVRKKIQVQLEYDDFRVDSIGQDKNGQIRIVARRNENANN